MPTVECLRLVGEARQAQLAGDNAVAISLAERAVQSSTTDSASYYSAFLVMADGHASEGDPGKAAEVCEMAMSICGPDTVGFAHNPVPWARCIVGAYEYTLQARAAGGGERARLPAWMSSAKKLQALSELAANLSRRGLELFGRRQRVEGRRRGRSLFCWRGGGEMRSSERGG